MPDWQDACVVCGSVVIFISYRCGRHHDYSEVARHRRQVCRPRRPTEGGGGSCGNEGESSRVIDGVVASNSKARVATGFESESGYIGLPRENAIGRTRLPCFISGDGVECREWPEWVRCWEKD